MPLSELRQIRSTASRTTQAHALGKTTDLHGCLGRACGWRGPTRQASCPCSTPHSETYLSFGRPLTRSLQRQILGLVQLFGAVSTRNRHLYFADNHWLSRYHFSLAARLSGFLRYPRAHISQLGSGVQTARDGVWKVSQVKRVLDRLEACRSVLGLRLPDTPQGLRAGHKVPFVVIW